MKRVAFFTYGLICYVMFLAVYAYFCGFVGNYFVPKTIDAPTSDSIGLALAIDLGLIALSSLQHSVMARPAFKQVWTRIVPHAIERSTYVLISNLMVMLLIWQWRTIDITVWNFSSGPLYYLLTALFVAGWLLVPAASLMISHFDLFGMRQVWLHLKDREYTSLPFRTPMLYGVVRHPLYVGWFLASWATPTMSVGHLLFAVTLTAYIVLASKIEERDLAAHFGPKYTSYQRRVPAFVPWPRRADATEYEAQPLRMAQD